MDLDNTLFDWVEAWYKSFTAMLEALVEDTGLPQEQLEREFREVHQRHGTSEYAFSLEELPSLRPFAAGLPIAERFKEAIKAYRFARVETLRLYPTVLETLQAFKAKGCLLVGYTESMQFYTNYRMRRLGLDLLLDFLYSPHDHALPFGMTREQVRRYPSDFYRYRHTLQRYTPPGEVKPNPEVLKDILRDVGADSETTIYIGDSLMKDISMAQIAGITGVWAKYGLAQTREEYAILRRVTHWPDDLVEKEKKLNAEDVEPTHTISSFAELQDLFNVQPFKVDAVGIASDEITKLRVEVWKTTVGVQQHFNDLELRIRNFAVTLAVGVVGALAVTLKEDLTLELSGFVVPVGVAILLVGIVGSLAFWFMDRAWYHRLLVGAVKHGVGLEKQLVKDGVIPQSDDLSRAPQGLTQTIGDESPLTIWGWKIRSKTKMDLFYSMLILSLVATLIVVAARIEKKPAQGQPQGAKQALPPGQSWSTPAQASPRLRSSPSNQPMSKPSLPAASPTPAPTP